jgi:superfamily II DNA or RNA helicase
MKPRPYQLKAVEAIEGGWAQFRKQIAVLPTGSGKTCIFSWIAQRRLPQKTLILAHREELIDQAIAKLHAATGIVAEKEKAESSATCEAQVVVASIQTMIRRLDRWPATHFGLVIVDEAHHALAESYRSILAHFDGTADVLGVTATPDRGDKRNLGEYFESVAYEVPLTQLILDGYLSRITIRSVPIDIDLTSVRTTAGDFNEADLGNALEPYLGKIAAAIREFASFRRVLAFLPLIATSQKFVTACRGVGLAAEHIDGTSEDRAEKLTAFHNCQFDVLSNAMLLTEGYDDPGIDCVVVLRPTRSRSLYAQMIGRGTRVHEYKDNLLLLDFLWHHERHALARPANLIASSDEEADIMQEIIEQAEPGGPDLELDEVAASAAHQREQKLRESLAEHKGRKGALIDAVEYALANHDLAAAEFEPTMKWERDEITGPQLKALKRAGVDAATVRGKGHASKLLNIYFSKARIELATPKQRFLMRKLGHPNPDQATAWEARQFFAGRRT